MEEAEGISLERLHTIGVTVPRRPGGRRRAPPPSARDRADGVLAGADLLALGLIQTLAVDGRLRVPQDIAVVGYDNNRAAWDSVVPITTLDQAGEEMGRAAAALLLEEIQDAGGAPAPGVLKLQPFLVPRQSSVRSLTALRSDEQRLGVPCGQTSSAIPLVVRTPLEPLGGVQQPRQDLDIARGQQECLGTPEHPVHGQVDVRRLTQGLVPARRGVVAALPAPTGPDS